MFGSKARTARRRQEFVATYPFPRGLGHDLSKAYPQLMSLDPAYEGLRQWLRLHMAEPELLAMPSRAVDLLWHEFILHTQEYEQFCRQAYGRSLHHSPERSMDGGQTQVLNGEGMARAFAMACADDGIRDPRLGLPALFTVDAALGLGDGQLWTFDCGATSCTAAAPWRCVRHQVLPFAPGRLPRQRDPRTGRWTQDPSNYWLYTPAGEFHDGGHHHGGQPDASHSGHAHSGSSCGGGPGANQGADGGGQHSESGNYGGASDSGSFSGGSDSGSSGGGSDGGSSCGGSSCGGSS